MEQCYKCGISEHMASLSNAITGEGIVKICNLCEQRESHPIISKTEVQKENEMRDLDIKKRLSKTNYLNPITQMEEEEKKDAHLKEIIKINFEQKTGQAPKKRDDLIDNFHWVIMRARRLKHVTQEKLARELKVSEQTIFAAEKGIIDEEGYDLAHKLETYLSIKIIKLEVREKMEEQEAKRIGFDPITTKELTINDLIDLKRKEEGKILGTEDEDAPMHQHESTSARGSSAQVGMPEGNNLNEYNEKVNIPTENEIDKMEENIKNKKSDTMVMGEPTKKSKISQEELDDLVFGR
jgi:DNA-binding XRE family transcriptional regulator